MVCLVILNKNRIHMYNFYIFHPELFIFFFQNHSSHFFMLLRIDVLIYVFLFIDPCCIKKKTIAVKKKYKNNKI